MTTPAINHLELLPGTQPFYFPGNSVGCLLIHGLSGTPDSMRGIGRHLAAQGYTVFAPRLPHHATHPGDLNRTHWRDWYFAALDGWHILRQNCDKIFVIGLSMGGATTLLLASRKPVDGIVTLSAPIFLHTDWRLKTLTLLKYIYPLYPPLPKNWRTQARKATHTSYPTWSTQALSSLLDYLSLVESALPNVTAPALLMHAKTDTVVPYENLEKIYTQISSRQKEFLLLDESIHVMTEGVAKNLVYGRITAFIEEQLAGTPTPVTEDVPWWQTTSGKLQQLWPFSRRAGNQTKPHNV